MVGETGCTIVVSCCDTSNAVSTGTFLSGKLMAGCVPVERSGKKPTDSDEETAKVDGCSTFDTPVVEGEDGPCVKELV